MKRSFSLYPGLTGNTEEDPFGGTLVGRSAAILRAFCCCFLFVLLGASFIAPARAQSFDRLEETRSNVAYFYHARPGQATVQVAVWGTVQRPGIYEIPINTRLPRLLTMTGGAPIQPHTEDQEKTVTLRLFRETGGKQTLAFETTLAEMLADTGRAPVVKESASPRMDGGADKR